MTDYLIPALFLLLFIFATFKKIPAYDRFVDGAKGAVNVCISTFPYLAAILIAVQLFRLSGAAAAMANTLAPAFRFLGMPAELAELVLLRPFTGSGSIALLNDVYAAHGADSYIGRCASVIMGSSETVFYVAGVYFAQSGVKRLRYAIPVALLVCLLSAALSCFLCRFM